MNMKDIKEKIQEQKEAAWHTLEVEEALALLESNPCGLTVEEAQRRISKFGRNILAEKKKKNAALRFLEQFNDFMIWVLLAAVLISGILLKEFLDAAVIMAIVLMNAVLGFVQESRAESALEELRNLSAPQVNVLRSGKRTTIKAEELVPGDIMVIEAGDKISADAVLLESASLKVNESSLTGESVPAEKDARKISAEDAPIGDRFNMVFAGTHVEYGRGKALVVATSSSTQMGKIAKMLEEGEPAPTPLQIELKDVGKRIVYICLATVVIVFTLGIIRGFEFAQMLLFAVSLAVAAIPEGLPAIVTITLAGGTRKMARENAIIRNLPAVETLGCANFICTDKTGTLTMNKMKVTDLLLPDGKRILIDDIKRENKNFSGNLRQIFEVAALCNDVLPGEGGKYSGEATELALAEAASSLGFDREELSKEFPRVAEIPFDSERKMMTCVLRCPEGLIVQTKGAVEEILRASVNVQIGESTVTLDEKMRASILAATRELASQGLRTIACAFKGIEELPHSVSPETLEHNLIFLGTFAMMDPPRPEVEKALETCRKAQIEVAMITGDHAATADAIARELEIRKPGMKLIEGRELEKMPQEELDRIVEKIRVYARVSPGHKVRIVDALQGKGHVVAMTGDGVNDAPALKRADIGVAMGITGTEVAKEASDMVLADDNFATIVSAVSLGRTIFSNLKKFIYFLLSCNISEVLVMFIAMLAGFPIPLLPVQILWVNLVTDGLPALALGVEPAEKDIMERPPRPKGENILSLEKQAWLLWQGLIITAGALASFVFCRLLLGYSWKGEGLDASRTVLFTTMVLTQVFHSFDMRSESRSILQSPPWENIWLLGSFFISIALQLMVLYVPIFQRAFHTVAPGPSAWALILACSVLPILIIDSIKSYSARRKKE